MNFLYKAWGIFYTLVVAFLLMGCSPVEDREQQGSEELFDFESIDRERKPIYELKDIIPAEEMDFSNNPVLEKLYSLKFPEGVSEGMELTLRLEHKFPKGTPASDVIDYLERSGAKCNIVGDIHKEDEKINLAETGTAGNYYARCLYNKYSNIVVHQYWDVKLYANEKLSIMKISGGYRKDLQ